MTVIASVAAIASPLAVPAIREAVGKYVAGFVQHRFDKRIENLKSDLRRSEEKFAADLRVNEQQLRSLADTTLSLRSSRQAALDARRLEAVEKIWTAKTATDRWKMAARMVSLLNLEEVFKAAEAGDPAIKNLGGFIDRLTGVDLKTEAPQMSATSEKPFLPPDMWVLFSAYQSVMTHSVIILKALDTGTTKYLKKEEPLKPLMLLALPEYETYIEKHGFSGYYHLLDILEQKLLNAITELLDGKAVDDATLKRTAEIMSAVRKINTQTESEVPEELRGAEIPEPPKI